MVLYLVCTCRTYSESELIAYLFTFTYWVPQKSPQICTVIHLLLYCEGCVIICGYLWGARNIYIYITHLLI